MELMIILSIVLLHELGHYSVAKFFGWRIRHIVLWIFGGTMKTDEHGNRPTYEEMLVTIAGPFQHILIYLTVVLLSNFQIIPASLSELILFYNFVILLFNLLPIWPLDGGKLLFLLLSLYLPYRKAYDAMIILSMILSVVIVIGQLVVYSFTLSMFLIMIFLFLENRKEWKHRYYVFMRFLLQRYEGDSTLNGVRAIVVPHHLPLKEVFTQFKRDKKHAIYIMLPGEKRVSIDESDCLHYYFHEKQYASTIGDLAIRI